MVNTTERKYNEPKTIEKVVDGSVKVKEKGLFGKIADILLSDDAKNVKSYILMDVIVPAVKDTIVNVVQSAIEMVFYGETKASSITKKSSGGTYVSYQNYYDTRTRGSRTVTQDNTRNRINTRDFIYSSRGDAERVLLDLTALVEEYQAASVADLCSLVGITAEWNENKFGWFDLSDAKIYQVRGGWRLDLPKPIYLE